MEDVITDEIHDFDPNTMPVVGNSCLWYAPSNAGKTTLMTYFFKQIAKNYQEIYLFSKTAHVQDSAFKFIPVKAKFDNLALEKLQSIIDSQKALIEENKHRKKHKRKPKKVPNIALVFDDIITDSKLRFSGVLDVISTLGRHLKLGLFGASQSASKKYSFNKLTRGNTRFVCAGFLRSENDRACIVEEYFSFESKKQGLAVYRKITSEPYTFAVIDLAKSVNAKKISDYIFKIKCPPPEAIQSFEVGDEKFWADDESRAMTQLNLPHVIKRPEITPEDRFGVETLITEDLIYNTQNIQTDYQPHKKENVGDQAERTRRGKKKVIQKVSYHT